MTKETNVYYKVLRWGHQHIDKGVSFEELKEFLADQISPQIQDSRAKELFRELFTPLEKGNLTVSAEIEALDSGDKFHLKLESAFRYIELQELEEARQSSRSAMKVAIAAIIIGVLVGSAQICVAIWG